jgi:ABC-type multidrug transport system permease subunit
VVAYACFVRRAWPVRVARWWNWAGVLILLNVVVHAQLSAPTRFRLFDTDPPATFIGDLPFIWLPGFLVPLAWALHALSLRQLRSTR